MAPPKKKKRSAAEYTAPARPKDSSKSSTDGDDVSDKSVDAATEASAKRSRPKKSKRNAQAPRRTMSARSQWLILASIAGLLVFGLLLSSFLSLRGGSGSTDNADWNLPLAADDIFDPGEQDGRVKLADFVGTPTVVKFFNSECVDCTVEYDWLLGLYDDTEGAFDLVFVDSAESGDWRAFADGYGLSRFPIASDIRGAARDGLLRDIGGNPSLLPATAYYTAEGELVQIDFEASSEVIFSAQLAEIGVRHPTLRIPATIVSTGEDTGEASDGSGDADGN